MKTKETIRTFDRVLFFLALRIHYGDVVILADNSATVASIIDFVFLYVYRDT